jgi:membrane protein
MERHTRIGRLLQRIGKALGLLWRALVKFYDDNGLFLSSGVTFNIFITLIPFIFLVLAAVGSYLHSDQEVLEHIRVYLRNVAPAMDPGIMNSLMDVIARRQALGLLGFIGSVWFSTWFFASLRVAFNIVFKVEKPRGIIHAFSVDLLMVGAVGTLFLMNMALSSLFALLQGYLDSFIVLARPAIQMTLRYLLPFFLTFCVFCLVYKVMPYEVISLRSTFKVALFTSLLWEAAKHLFAWYIGNIAQYSLFYGSLSTLVVFVLWIYYSATIFVVGGELLYLLEKERKALTASEEA